jgi:hypothetical protein
LQGSAEQQLAALRDYLFRLAGSLESIQSAPAVSVGAAAKSAAGGAGDAAEKIRQNARELKALILKTADTITAEMDSREEEYRGCFLAQSEFGDFEENLDLRIETNARNIVEGYGYASAIRAAEDNNTCLYCGEYGVIDRAAPEDTVKWYRTIHSTFEKHGISRCAWSYKQMDFGLSDSRLDGVRDQLIPLL